MSAISRRRQRERKEKKLEEETRRLLEESPAERLESLATPGVPYRYPDEDVADDGINLVQQWTSYNKLLDALEADEALHFINARPFSRTITSPLKLNTEMMEERVNVILNNCDPPPLKVLEFGGGYGNFCRTYSKHVPKSEFTMIDNLAMLKFAKVFLRKHDIDPSYVASPDALSIKGNFDMFVAFSSISECSSAYRSKILSEFLPRSKTVIIGETAPQISLWVKDYITTHFKFIHVVHSTRLQDGHSLIFASNDDTLKVEL